MLGLRSEEICLRNQNLCRAIASASMRGRQQQLTCHLAPAARPDVLFRLAHARQALLVRCIAAIVCTRNVGQQNNMGLQPLTLNMGLKRVEATRVHPHLI